MEVVVTVAGKQSDHRETVYGMLRRGYNTRHICELTGLSVQMVNRYRMELSDLEPQRPKESMEIRQGFGSEWTEAANRIRKYLGKPEFPMPKEGT